MSVDGLGRAASSARALLVCLAGLAVVVGPAHGADVIPPDTGITAPASTAVGSLPTISGTAIDTGGSLLASVKIRIQELTTLTYWNSATGMFDFSLAPPSAWFDADAVDGAFNSNTEVWSSTGLATAIAATEGPYTLEAYAIDGAGNPDASPASLTFTLDLTPPVSSVATPADAVHRLTMTGIVGGAADFVTAVATVQVRVQDMGTGFYWDGANSFSATEFWSTAALAGPFFSQTFGAPLTYGTTYQVVSKAFDLAGNAQNAFTVGVDSVSFLLDNSPPSTAAVTGLFASSATASWALVYGSTGYNLVSSLNSANPPTVAVASATSAEFETSAALSGLTPNTTYSFFVRAQGPAAATAYRLFATSATDANAPASPTAQVDNSTQVTLSWAANGNPSGSLYVAQISAASNFSSILASSQTFSTTAVFAGLSSGTAYYLRVKTAGHNGTDSAFSASASTTTASGAATDAISGTVKTSGGTAINLVEVDLYDASNARVGSPAFTDAGGAWNISGLTTGATYRVAATWTLNGVSSQIFQDGHHPGESGVPFTVELTVTLGSFTGTLHLAGTGPTATRAATRDAASAAFVEIYQNGVKVGSVATDAQGRFVVSNLLPGSYALRPFNGSSYGVMTNVSVAAGQQAEVTFASTTEFLPLNLVYFYPNPARDHAVIRFESSSPSLTAEASIYDLTGGLVRVLTDGEATRSAGETSWNWNLTDSRGTGVASGVYFVRVKVVDAASGRRAAVTKKLAVVR